MQAKAVGGLLERRDFPTALLQGKDSIQCGVVGYPWNVVARTKCAFQDVSMRRVTRDAAQVQSLNPKRVCRAKTSAHVLATSNVVKDKPNRQPLRCCISLRRDSLAKPL